MLVLACASCVSEDADAVPGASTGSQATDKDADDGSSSGGVPLDPAMFAEQYATQRCATFYECGCEDDPFGGLQACIDAIRAEVEGDNADFTAAGLKFDPTCAAKVLEIYENAGCIPFFDHVVATQNVVCEEACRTWYGDIPEGGECDVFPQIDACGAGMKCGEAGTCGTYCDLEIGEGGPCSSARECAWDLHCGTGGVCRASPGEGEPCAESWQGIQTYCQDALGCVDGICRRRLPGGEPCTEARACESQRCTDGVCEPSPPLACSIAL